MEFQTTLFQPVGGMDAIARAMTREVADVLQLRAKVNRDPSGQRRCIRDLAGHSLG